MDLVALMFSVLEPLPVCSDCTLFLKYHLQVWKWHAGSGIEHLKCGQLLATIQYQFHSLYSTYTFELLLAVM